MAGLIYDASDYQRYLWNDHKMADEAAQGAELAATERYEAFPEFAEEMYHFFHADEPERLAEPGSGSEVFQQLDSAMNQVPEVGDLRAQTIGNDRWAGIVTASMIDTLLTKVPAPDSQIMDPRGDEETMAYLERLLADAQAASDTEQAEQLEQTMGEILDGLETKREACEAAADAMDPTGVRQAIRTAVSRAKGEIKAEQQLMDAFSIGTDKHDGRTVSMAIGAKLAKLVGSNERLRKIAEFAGRLRRIASEEQRNKPRFGCGERVDRKPDNDLARLCHRELVYGAGELLHVFGARYAERSLTCIEKAERPKERQGPIVMVLDSSGSMRNGDADVWAAAVCLAYMDVARKQGRDFAIVHFGSTVLRTDVFIGKGAMTAEAITDAINFFAADGGTNFEESLTAAAKIIRDAGAFLKADIVMITDGCASVSDAWLAKFAEDRTELEFRVYSVLVGAHCQGVVNRKFSDEVEHLSNAIKDEKQMHHLFGKV